MDEAGSPHFKLLAKWRVVHRTSGGANAVCKVMERYEKQAVEKERISLIKKMLNQGFSKDTILNLGFSEKEFTEAKKILTNPI